MKVKNIARIAGVFLLGAFALTVYIGLADSNLRTYAVGHWYVNWLFAVADLVAVILLLGFPARLVPVALGGIIWPILYVIALAADVQTRLCIGEPSSVCQPSRSVAFQYLILNNRNIAQPGYSWVLWQGTVPTILALMALALVLSVVAIYYIRVSSRVKPISSPVSAASGSNTSRL